MQLQEEKWRARLESAWRWFVRFLYFAAPAREQFAVHMQMKCSRPSCPYPIFKHSGVC